MVLNPNMAIHVFCDFGEFVPGVCTHILFQKLCVVNYIWYYCAPNRLYWYDICQNWYSICQNMIENHVPENHYGIFCNNTGHQCSRIPELLVLCQPVLYLWNSGPQLLFTSILFRIVKKGWSQVCGIYFLDPIFQISERKLWFLMQKLLFIKRCFRRWTPCLNTLCAHIHFPRRPRLGGMTASFWSLSLLDISFIV